MTGSRVREACPSSSATHSIWMRLTSTMRCQPCNRILGGRFAYRTENVPGRLGLQEPRSIRSPCSSACIRGARTNATSSGATFFAPAGRPTRTSWVPCSTRSTRMTLTGSRACPSSTASSERPRSPCFLPRSSAACAKDGNGHRTHRCRFRARQPALRG